MPMTVETEPLDVAGATEEPTLRLHDDEIGDEAADDAVDAAIAAEIAAETATVDYDDAVVEAGDDYGTEATTTNTATPVAVQVAKPSTKSADDASEKLREITQVSEEVRRNRERVALIKDELKEAKEDLQGSVNRLMRITAAISNDEARPLLAAAETKVESTAAAPPPPVDTVAAGDESQTQPELAPSPAAPSTEAWRSYRFDEATHFPTLAAQKAIVAKLSENSPPINTIGDLLDFQKPVGDYSKGLTDIKGIGTGKAEKIENALEQFWADHPELVQEAVDAS